MKLIKYSFVICNIDICYVVANFHRYEDSDGAWPLMVGISAKLSCSKFVWESQICPKFEALWQVISVFEQLVKRISVKSWFEPLRPVMTAIELCEEKFLQIIHTRTIPSTYIGWRTFIFKLYLTKYKILYRSASQTINKVLAWCKKIND